MFRQQGAQWRFDWHDSWSEVWSPAVMARWSALLARDATAHAFHDPRVVRAWAETHGRAIGAEPMFGFATDSSGREVFVTWAVVAGRGRYARRRSLVHAGDTFFGYHNPLVGSSDRDAIDWASFWRCARESVGPAVDQALLRLVDSRYAAGPLAEPLGEMSPVLSLVGVETLGKVLSRCSASHRSDVSRQTRRLRASGELTLTVHRDHSAADAALESFSNDFGPAYSAYWRRRPEGCMLDRPGVASFVERVVAEGLRSGWAHYDVLTLGGTPIAWHIGLSFRDCTYWWIPAHDPAWQAFSPGKVLLALFIEQAIADGIKSVHFLTGAQKYKLDWKPSNLTLSSVRWHAPSVKGTALSWYDAGWRLVRRARRDASPRGSRMNPTGDTGSGVGSVAIRRRALDPGVRPLGGRAFSEGLVSPLTIAKQALLKTVAAATRRHPVLLPQAAADEASMLDVVAPYRVEGGELVVTIRERRPGTLTAALLTPQQPNSSRLLWRSPPLRYDGPSALRFNLSDGTVWLAERRSGEVPLPLPSRRFSWSLDLQPSGEGSSRSRVTGHYVPGSGVVDDAYYSGENYVDYEAESVSTREMVVELARRYPFRGQALEIGCATGALLEDLTAAGFDAVGIDYSAWAVERARERVGADRVWQIDVERERPDSVLGPRAPFGALIMLSVFEHFADPFAILERLSAFVEPGGRLFLTTTNADGLGHCMFGGDWEGYFDWTHLGVDLVSARSIREGFPRLGWRVEQLETTVIWDGNADPTHATLREWWVSDARFRRLLVERDLGDLITCVATKL